MEKRYSSLDSAVKSRKQIAASLNQILGKRLELKQQDSLSQVSKEQGSTEATEFLDFPESPSQGRQESGKKIILNPLKNSKETQKLQGPQSILLQHAYQFGNQKQRLIEAGSASIRYQRAQSQISTGASTGTPVGTQHNLSNNQSPMRKDQYLQSPNIQSSQKILHDMRFIPQQRELDQIFKRAVNSEIGKFYNFLQPSPKNQNLQLHSMIYQKLAPISSVYNDSLVFETKRLSNQSMQNNKFPKYYFKEKRENTNKSYGKQYAYRLINDMTLEKKNSINMLIKKRSIQASNQHSQSQIDIP